MFKLILFFILVVFFAGCAPSSHTTTWKDRNAARLQYNKILVVAVVQDTSVVLRRSMEEHLAEDLLRLGYRSVAAINEFGPNGLANLEQEATYVKLCDKGVDAVLTIALLDQQKELNFRRAEKPGSGIYFYNRIWNYRNMSADLTKGNVTSNEKNRFFWETMLFDLATLSPVYMLQTRSFKPPYSDAVADEYGKLIVGNMLRNKILKAQQISTNQLQAF